MKIRLRGQIFFSLGMTLIFSILIAIGMGYNPLARLIPLVVSVPALLISFTQFILDLRETLRGEPPDQEAAGKEGARRKEKRGFSPQELRHRELLAVGWLLAFLGLIILAGFLAAIPIFILVFMRLYGRESWRLSLGLAVVLLIFVYAVFEIILGSDLYQGLILETIKRYW